jgi:hypothetical protein
VLIPQVRAAIIYSKVWFNTPELCSGPNKATFTKFGIKPDGIINFLSNEPPLKQGAAKDTAELCSAEAHLGLKKSPPMAMVMY